MVPIDGTGDSTRGVTLDAVFVDKTADNVPQSVQALMTELSQDPLWIEACRQGISAQALPLDVLTSIEPGRQYATLQLADLIRAEGVAESTLRSWATGLFVDYVQPQKDGRSYRFPGPAVCRMRLLFFFKETLGWPLPSIRNLITGLPGGADPQGLQEKGEMAAALADLAPLGGLGYDTMDPRMLHVLSLLVDVEASSREGRLVINRAALPQDLLERVDSVDRLSAAYFALEDRMRDELEAARREQGAIARQIVLQREWERAPWFVRALRLLIGRRPPSETP